MHDERNAVVRVGFDEPIVLLRHLVAPDTSRAAGEVAAMRPLLRGGGRAVLLVIDQAIPPPNFAALKLYRDLIESEPSLEWIAIVNPHGGFALTIAAGVMAQLLKFTRLSGRMATFTELGPACTWLAGRLEAVVDLESVGEGLDELFFYTPEVASVG